MWTTGDNIVSYSSLTGICVVIKQNEGGDNCGYDGESHEHYNDTVVFAVFGVVWVFVGVVGGGAGAGAGVNNDDDASANISRLKKNVFWNITMIIKKNWLHDIL